jgi:hypothetical protein
LQLARAGREGQAPSSRALQLDIFSGKREPFRLVLEWLFSEGLLFAIVAVELQLYVVDIRFIQHIHEPEAGVAFIHFHQGVRSSLYFSKLSDFHSIISTLLRLGLRQDLSSH